MLTKDLQKFYTLYKQNSTWHLFVRTVKTAFIIGTSLFLMTGSNTILAKYPDNVRNFTRPIEFNYVSWTLDAIWQKVLQNSISLEEYLPVAQSTEVVRRVINIESQIQKLESEISVIFSSPEKSKFEQLLKEKQIQLANLREMKSSLAPLAEAALQDQISEVLAENGLTFLGQPLPPVLYHSTPLPMALIVSPRNQIQQDANISLLADMSALDLTGLEDRVMNELNVSALVVPVGGVGIYPTMVMATSNLPFLGNTVAHEWTHNLLTIRPLGLNYETNAQLRTINETTASIVGNEIGNLLLKKYYPEFLPPASPDIEPMVNEKAGIKLADTPPVFDFQQEMHFTRVKVDELLASGKIDDAEAFMEQRRLYMWENGYPIRRLNQAYFAFYGAYADVPGGAAGEDPVGPMVRALREKSSGLSQFLERISWVTSYQQLVELVNSTPL